VLFDETRERLRLPGLGVLDHAGHELADLGALVRVELALVVERGVLFEDGHGYLYIWKGWPYPVCP
jgi:hypothetical protein